MTVKIEAFQPRKDSTEEIEEAVPFIIPMFLWDILVALSDVEKCSPGEVLDKAVCEYLQKNERMKIVKERMGH